LEGVGDYRLAIHFIMSSSIDRSHVIQRATLTTTQQKMQHSK